MDVPLGRAVGNALEVIECIETLQGRGPKDLEDLSVTLAARMVRLAGLATSNAEATTRVRSALTSGVGLETFRRIVEQQGGEPRIVDDFGRLPRAPKGTSITADRAGYVTEMHAEAIGIGAMMLGAGRNRAEDRIDHAVGVIVRARVSERVKAGDAILEVHHRDDASLAAALPMLRKSIKIGDAAPTVVELVVEEVK